ncbi:MerC domain-containing protein [uncultured Polaribacter sp.]|uniref:MerC domain-containing protein n=1 Tax=uncultured Polaribacter sp. TaxID=174711 RepID=UPI002608F643|nr:MerC domain-containing protein [uncultured Polaribacter sp.]
MNLVFKKSDTIGMFSSGLCMVHCLLTPFIFVSQINTNVTEQIKPFWWSNLDYLFLVIGFFAVFQSTKNTTRTLMKILLWLFWSLLFLLVLNEKNEIFHLPDLIMYAVTITLVILHFYNLKYCTCTDGSCCVSDKK